MQVPRRRPVAFNSKSRARNIISYSLFGDDLYYRECAITNARQARFAFPEFTARFYCSAGVPEPALQALAATGAQIKISEDRSGAFFGALMWRFLALDDPDVDVVLVRDVDSPLLSRERAAIDLWLQDDAPFHVLRDNILHTAPIMAGLWGGFTGLLPKLGPKIVKYLQVDTTRYCDQSFLSKFVWPQIRDATLAIDSVYSLGKSVDFPAAFPKHGRDHVGVSWSRQQILGPSQAR
jgi:hypothetical protein